MAEEIGNLFDRLYQKNLNAYTEERDGNTYLSWSNAWAEFQKACPDATYEVKMFNGLPYVADDTGYMVFTSVTADGITRDMWLPVLNGAQKPMKKEPYTMVTKNGKEIRVDAATMFDINKAIMRCLVKNLAMFGLGLYIYNGEDMPEADAETLAADLERNKRIILDMGVAAGRTEEQTIVFSEALFGNMYSWENFTIEMLRRTKVELARKIEKDPKIGGPDNLGVINVRRAKQ